MTVSGAYRGVWKQGAAAGISGIRPHVPSHSFAHHWLANEGTKGDLMRLAGWRLRTMLSRYVASAADDGRERLTSVSTQSIGCRCR